MRANKTSSGNRQIRRSITGVLLLFEGKKWLDQKFRFAFNEILFGLVHSCISKTVPSTWNVYG